MELSKMLTTTKKNLVLNKHTSLSLYLSVFALLVILLLISDTATAFRASTPSVVIAINPGATDVNSQNPYNQSKVTVPVGTNVTWLNNDPTAPGLVPGISGIEGGHSIVSGDPDNGPSNIFYLQAMDFGETYTYLFTTPGTYPYYDKNYPHMRGQIQVIPSSNDTNTN